MNREIVLMQLKTLLGIPDDNSLDELLNIVINECIDRVVGYCRIEEFPPLLESLLPIMAHRAYVLGGYGRADPVGQVVGVKQGERSVTYESPTNAGGDWIMDFKDRLEPFRRKRGRLPSELD